jgi:hypothetical protein
MSERGQNPKTTKRRRQFDPAVFLATAAEGRSIAKHQNKEIIFTQGDAADAVFYIRKARSRSLSFPSRARKRWSQFWV